MKLLRLRIILAAMICAATLQTHARTLTWTGNSFTDPTSWSKSGNWSPSFVPADGDALIFPGGFTTFNDLVNLHVFSITFNGSSGSTLNGNSILLDSAITCNHSSGRARVNFDITFTTGGVFFYTFSDGYLDIEQNVNIGNNELYLYPLNASPSGTNIEVHGIISGSGGLTKLGNGDAYLLGVWPNDYTGQTTVSAGNLHLAKSGVTAISDRMVIGVNTTAGCLITDHADGQYPAGIAATIGNTGWWTINHSATVTNLTLSHGIIDGPGILSLLSDVTFLPQGPSYVSCPLYLGNVTRTFNLPSNAQLILTGVVIGPGLGNNSPGIIKQGAGDLHLGGANSYFGPTIIQDGSLWVENNSALGSFGGGEARTTVESGKIILNIVLNGTVNESVVMAGGEFKFSGAQTLNGSLVLSNYVYFSGLDQYSQLQINSVISGPGTMEVNGGTVQFGGSTPNTFEPGGVRVFPRSTFPATLELAKPDNVLAVPGGAYVEGSFTQPAVLRNLHNGGVTNVFIFNGGVWQLNGHSVAPVSVTVWGNGSVDATGSGQLQLNYSGTDQFHVYPYNGGISALVTGTVACVTGIDDITVEAGCSLNIAGPIIGGGALRKLGAGTLKLTGSTANSYSGGTLVNEGTLELRKSNNNVLAVPGNLIIGPAASNSFATARFFQHGGVLQNGAVTVNANSLFDLNSYGQILSLLNLNDGGDAQTGGGILEFSPGGTVNVDTLNYDLGLRASSQISGLLALPYHDHLTFNVIRYDGGYFSTAPELDVTAGIYGNGDIFKQGPGQMRFSGNNAFNDDPPTSTGNIQVLGGMLIAASATALGGTGGVTFVDTAGTLALDGSITITGEPLSLFSTNAPGLMNLSGANTWSGDIRFYRDSIVGVNAGSSLLINGTIFGTGGLTKIKPGLLTLGGLNNNTYSGDTFANEGTLVLDKVAISGVITVPHHITVGTTQTVNAAALIENDSSCIAGSVTVNNGGLWILGQGAGETFQDFELQGHDPLTLNGNAQVQGPGFLYLPPGGGIVVNPGSNSTATISADIGIGTLLAGPTSHPVAVNAGSFQSGNPECVINGSISPVFDVTGLQKEGAGTLRLTGTNSYAGTNLVNGGTLWVDGVQPQSAVHLNTGTRLKGSGTVGNINLIGSSATISPGASPGILTCSNFNALAGSGTLQIELNGTTPGTGYDQLNVRGTVNLNGVSLNRSSSFSPAVSDQFTLINNDASDAVTGTFTGFLQGAKLYAGNDLFQISYTGGSGNDVVLTHLVNPPPPVLTIQAIKTNSVRLIWATNDPQFRLLTISSLATNNWNYALPPSVITGTNNVVTNLIILPQKFYRLTNQ